MCNIYVTVSLPEAIVNLYLILAIIGCKWRRHAVRNLFVSFLISLSAYATFSFIPLFPLRISVNILIHLFIFKALCQFSWRGSTLATTFYFVLILAKESFFAYMLDFASIVTIEGLIDHDPVQIVTVFGLSNILTLFLGLFLSYTNISLSRWFYKQPKEYRRLSENICILFLVLFLIVLYANTQFLYTDPGLYKIVGLVVFVILFIGIALLISFTNKMEKQSVTLVENVYLENMKNLINLIRSQRHDHINQIYVLSNLLQDKKFEEAIEYLGEYRSEIHLTQNLINIDHLPLACLLQSKAEIAIQSHIQIEFDVQTKIPNINMKSYELIQVIGNLLDNAIEAERKEATRKRYIKFSVERMLHTMLVFQVYNANSYIPEDARIAIFHEGCTTKENHSGIGLSIVKRLASKYQGHIEVESEQDEGTTFYVFLPVAM